MSISDGQPVDASNSNAAWASKTADNTLTGQQTLNKSGSGGTITDLQQEVNNKQDRTVVDAKGDLIAGTADDTTDRVPVGNDDEALVADSLASTGVSYKEVVLGIGNTNSTDNAVVRWDGTTGKAVQDSGVLIDDSNNVTIPGNLTVNGTTTQIDTTNTNVKDANITLNDGGNDATSEGSGITVERTGTDGSLVYEDALASKFKAGPLGTEVELANVSSAQTLTNKTIDGDNNTISNLAHGSEVDNPSSGVHGVTGSVVGTTDTQTLTNKTFTDNTTTVQDDLDNTKKFKFQASGITTATTRTYTVPDKDTTLMGNDTTDTMTNKTFDADGTGNTLSNVDDGNIKSGAAIARTKLASGTASHVVINDGSGVMSSEANLAISRGGTGAGTATAAFDGLAPSTTKGDLIVHNGTNNIRVAVGTNDQVLTADSTQASGVKWADATGGGSGVGGITYIPDGDADFETDTGTWATYDDGAVATPVDGTAGSPSVITISRTTVAAEVLRGTGSLKVAKTAADGQGEGFSLTLDKVDLTDRGKNLTVSFDYLTESGYTSGDWGVYRYDIDGTTMVKIADLEPSSTAGSKFTAVFPTTTGNDDYRLVFHMTSTNTTAYDTFFDNFKVGPDSEITTPVIDDWISFTPTGSWTTNTTYTGRYRRVGDSIEIDYRLTFDGAPNSTTLELDLPFTADSNKMTGSVDQVVGDANFLESGVRNWLCQTRLQSTTKVRLTHTESTNGGTVDETRPFVVSSGDVLSASVTVPISGWDAGAVVSNTQLQNQTIRARYKTAATNTINTGATTIIDFDTSDYDSHGAVTTGASWKFTAPRSGKYRVTSMIFLNDTTNFSGTEKLQLDVHVNGSNRVALDHRRPSSGEDYPTVRGSAIVDINAGDYIDVRALQDSGANISLFAGNTLNYIEIESLEDFTVYGAVQDVGRFTEWASFTPTGSWSTNTTWTGFWRRVGDSMEVRARATLTGAPDAANLTITLPNSRTIDTAKMTTASSSSTVLGTVRTHDSGTGQSTGQVTYNSTTSVACQYIKIASANANDTIGNISNTAPQTFASGDTVEAVFTIPITGWS